MSNSVEKFVAVVTGSNKGIGFAIVKALLKDNYPGYVYVTSRDITKGQEAVKELEDLGFYPEFHQLDIDDEDSVSKFASDLRLKHGGIELLINNAAIKYSSGSNVPYQTQIVNTLKTNYYGTRCVCNHLFPLIRKDGQVINISSSAGHINCIPNNALKNQFIPELTAEGIDSIIDSFIRHSLDLDWVKNWKHAGYVLSKVALNALTVAQQNLFDNTKKSQNIRVNAVHPGYVCTDMTNRKGIQTPDEGAKSTIFLALNNDHNYRGTFFWYDSSEVEWLSDNQPIDIKP